MKKKINVAKAIQIYAEFEAFEIIISEEIRAYNAPGECGSGGEKRYQIAEENAGISEDELNKLCKSMGFDYRRISERLISENLKKHPLFK